MSFLKKSKASSKRALPSNDIDTQRFAARVEGFARCGTHLRPVFFWVVFLNQQGSLNYLFGGHQTMQMYGKFDGFPKNSALFGLVIHHDPCSKWVVEETLLRGNDEIGPVSK